MVLLTAVRHRATHLCNAAARALEAAPPALRAATAAAAMLTLSLGAARAQAPASQPGPASQPSDALVIADFGTAVSTAQGGLFRATGGRPDVVRDCLAELGQPPRWSWRLDVLERAPRNGVGGFLPLFDNHSGAAPGRPLDISATPFLELTLIGELGRRTLRVEVNPEAIPDAETGAAAIASFDAAKLSPDQWRALILRVPGKAAGVVRLILEGEGPAWLAVDRARFCASEKPSAWVPLPPERPKPIRVAMWVWTTDEDLAEKARADTLLDFCRGRGITDVFLQIPYEYDSSVELKLTDAMRDFNIAADRAKIRVHALDGAPRYVLPENHARMFELVAALERFNRDGPPEGRFDAIHLDNEPYVLPEWKDPAKRPPIITAYVELNRELRRRANAAGMELGLDIPFWFDRRDPSGEPAFPVETPKGTVSLLEALFGIAQNVAVMSYRERVTGPNGVVAVCRDEFELARRYGVEVFTSIELGAGPKVEEGISLGRYPRDYFAAQLATLRRVLGYEPNCRGLAIHNYVYYRRMEEQQ